MNMSKCDVDENCDSKPMSFRYKPNKLRDLLKVDNYMKQLNKKDMQSNDSLNSKSTAEDIINRAKNATFKAFKTPDKECKVFSPTKTFKHIANTPISRGLNRYMTSSHSNKYAN